MTTDSRTRWVILAVSYLSIITIGLSWLGWTVALNDIANDLSLNYTQAGLLSSVTALTGGISLVLGGIATDKIGCKMVILLGLAAGFGGLILFAFADSFPVAIVAKLICGVSVGLLYVGPFTMVLNWFRNTRHSGTAVGTLLTGDGVYSLVALYLCALLIISVGWRPGLAIQAGIVLVIFIVSLLLLKNPPAGIAEESARLGRARVAGQILHCLRRTNVLTGAAYLVVNWGIVGLISSWMPTILINDAGWSESSAGLLVSLLAATGILTAFLFGALSDKYKRRKKLLVLAGFATFLSMAILTLALANGWYGLVVVMLPVVGLCVYAGVPLAIVLAAESVDGRHTGIANGIVLGGGFLVGGFAFPYVLGVIKDTTGSFVGGILAATVGTLVLGCLVQLLARDFVPSTREKRYGPERNELDLLRSEHASE
ncbi:sugar phosphate permease [Arthrobacter oryzae]|uniref:Major facilitator superfamily (MFS) transporter n=1 Tax=Paenarthrobacter aurescens (strain TC1) TaxID=290340 RepID=A1R4J7_PAEAT|nr:MULTISPECIES: MFS transporter [Micrococcaceae]ABM06427.1 putative major facilitator superfamily (MFS) transporter [Paenarthrobacter aurescens TC1]MDP9989131.1 sugar phosphate permease [Arthrobacter oryzae]